MAEVAGLSLGGFALLSLFSTCIELLDYLDECRTCARDIQIGLAKFGFLKHRLNTWGQAVSLPSLACDEVARADKATEQESLIAEGLTGIYSLLAATSVLGDKYSCGRLGTYNQSTPGPGIFFNACNSGTSSTQPPWGAHLKSGQGGWCPTCDIAHHKEGETYTLDVGLRDDQSCDGISLSDSRLRSGSKMARCPPSRFSAQRLRLKFTWVLSDRKRFNALIADLDSLISGLERLGEEQADMFTTKERRDERSQRPKIFSNDPDFLQASTRSRIPYQPSGRANTSTALVQRSHATASDGGKQTSSDIDIEDSHNDVNELQNAFGEKKPVTVEDLRATDRSLMTFPVQDGTYHARVTSLKAERSSTMLIGTQSPEMLDFATRFLAVQVQTVSPQGGGAELEEARSKHKRRGDRRRRETKIKSERYPREEKDRRS